MTPLIRSLVRRVSSLAPPHVRRAAAGALMDVKSVPARIRNPARRGEPLAVLHNVGGGEYGRMGEVLLQTLRTHAGLRPQDSVLDIGCGTGRVATPMAQMLAAGGGRYLGFDVSRMGVAECRRRFARQPHMAFAHIDVRNGEYNARGRVAELDAVFPAEDNWADLAFATSVFTHMKMPAVRRYLAECARVLKPGGRLAFTAFALEPGRTESRACPFQRYDATSSILDPRSPETGIGHDRPVLEAALAEAGFEVAAFLKGAWSPPAEYDGFQDLYVATRP